MHSHMHTGIPTEAHLQWHFHRHPYPRRNIHSGTSTEAKPTVAHPHTSISTQEHPEWHTHRQHPYPHRHTHIHIGTPIKAHPDTPFTYTGKPIEAHLQWHTHTHPYLHRCTHSGTPTEAHLLWNSHTHPHRHTNRGTPKGTSTQEHPEINQQAHHRGTLRCTHKHIYETETPTQVFIRIHRHTHRMNEVAKTGGDTSAERTVPLFLLPQ